MHTPVCIQLLEDLPPLVDWVAKRCAAHVRGNRLRLRIKAQGLKQILTWEIYGIIKHDLSSHVNLPSDFPGQCGRSMHQQIQQVTEEEEEEDEDIPHINMWCNERV